MSHAAKRRRCGDSGRRFRSGPGKDHHVITMIVVRIDVDTIVDLGPESERMKTEIIDVEIVGLGQGREMRRGGVEGW